MAPLNRDAWVAIFLLLACGVLFYSSFDIREPDYGQLSPATWPRIVIGALSVLCLIYLVQSVRAGPSVVDTDVERPIGFMAHLAYWRNVLWCFGLFFVYLLTLPTLGMLIGGVLFVFFLLNALGGWTPRHLGLHATIALATVGGMWSLFTFGLGVILPGGEILGEFF
jgi:putative tricarboxylic transport membrane protein